MQTSNANPLFSRAKSEVLSVLLVASQPVCLREISYRSGLEIRSVQLSLKSLVREGVVRREKSSYRVFFSLNKEHECFGLLKEWFELLERNRLKERAKGLSSLAPRALSSANELFCFAKSLPRVGDGS